jgi:hypothetical protein
VPRRRIQAEGILTGDVRALQVARLTANQAETEFDVVVALGPAHVAQVLEVVVDVLQGNEGSVTYVAEPRKTDRRQVLGLIVEIGRKRPRSAFLDDHVGRLRKCRVERERQVVDAGEGGAQIDQQRRSEDVGKSEAVLLLGVCRRAVEVKLAAADLRSRGWIGSKTWRSEGVDLVVVVPAEEGVVRVEAVIDADVEAVNRPINKRYLIFRCSKRLHEWLLHKVTQRTADDFNRRHE